MSTSADRAASARIRLLEPERELDEFLAVRNQDQAFPMTAEHWRERDRRVGDQTYRRNLVAEQDGRIVAVGLIANNPLLEDGVWVNVTVDRAWRGRGHGTTMANAVAELVRERRPSILEARMRDDDERSRQWAERWGFEVATHTLYARLDLETFDAGAYEDVAARAQEAGVEFRVVDSAEGLYDLYVELATIGEEDIPSREFFDGHFSTARGDFFVVGVSGSERVALATVEMFEHGGAWNGFVGASHEARPRGVLEALQLRVVEESVRRGRSWVGTAHGSRERDLTELQKRMSFDYGLSVLTLRRPGLPFP